MMRKWHGKDLTRGLKLRIFRWKVTLKTQKLKFDNLDSIFKIYSKQISIRTSPCFRLCYYWDYRQPEACLKVSVMLERMSFLMTWFWIELQYIPGCMVRDHKILLKPNLVLRDEDGDLWHTKICSTSQNRISLTVGWSKFYKTHKLKLNDKCEFEFVLEKGNVCRQLNVKVTRRRRRWSYTPPWRICIAETKISLYSGFLFF